MSKIEYRVRPVTRYIVTRYEIEEGLKQGGGSRILGEWDNGSVAYEVGYALAKQEADLRGYGPGDERIVFPSIPKDVSVYPQAAYRVLAGVLGDDNQASAAGL